MPESFLSMRWITTVRKSFRAEKRPKKCKTLISVETPDVMFLKKLKEYIQKSDAFTVIFSKWSVLLTGVVYIDQSLFVEKMWILEKVSNSQFAWHGSVVWHNTVFEHPLFTFERHFWKTSTNHQKLATFVLPTKWHFFAFAKYTEFSTNIPNTSMDNIQNLKLNSFRTLKN